MDEQDAVSLKDYFIALLESYEQRNKDRFQALEDSMEAQLHAAQEAVLKAEGAVEKRFESVNEFRKTLSDQTLSFIPRDEYHTAHKALIDSVEKRFDSVSQFRQALSDQTAEFLRRKEFDAQHRALLEKVDAAVTRLQKIESRSEGLNAGWILLGQMVTIVLSIAAFMLAVLNKISLIHS